LNEQEVTTSFVSIRRKEDTFIKNVMKPLKENMEKLMENFCSIGFPELQWELLKP